MDYTFVDVGSKELEDYEEKYFDEYNVLKLIGAFRTSRYNVLSAIEAGWFVEEIDIDEIPLKERVELSRKIDELYNKFLPFSQKGAPTDPNV